MMSSNIRFESNVYPVSEQVNNDRAYISKIWDYNRIYTLDKRYCHNVPWSDIQRQILREKPICSLNKEDPCWGMIKTEKGYEWVCRCTKTECQSFSNCRKAIPYIPEIEQQFEPKSEYIDEYGYSRFCNEYSAYPVIVGDNVDYSGSSIIGIKKSNIKDAFAAIFGRVINNAEVKVLTEDVNTDISDVSCVTPEPQNDNSEFESMSNSDETYCPEEQLYLSLNIFKYFEEGSQSDIITANKHENFFVDAGPGTGKTYTLIQKLNYLVCDEGVEADGILVLCFTNAAVDEIKMRLKQSVVDGADRSLVNVDVRTFHSFAWWLINQANTVLVDEGWSTVNMQALTYEASLAKASDVVSQFGNSVVGNWEYFIVDEVQDLTNTLGRLVLDIVTACLNNECGVTVLGDACQAIYDYNQDTWFDPMKSADFYKELFKKMYGKTHFIRLTENHRQGDDLIKLTSQLRDGILANDTNKMNKAVEYFKNSVETSATIGSQNNEDFLEKMQAYGSVGMLLRNNGQTLKMSSDLRKRGIAHTLNISETHNNYAAWIADVFASYKNPTVSEDIFIELYEETTGLDGKDVWERFQRLLHTNNDVLNVRELLNAIAVSKIDDPILRTTKERSTVVSNIHRSKGREYDCVLVDKSFVDSFLENSPEDEYKTLYVAITRPRKKLVVVPLQDRSCMKLIYNLASGRKRWGMVKNKKISYLEFDTTKDIVCDCFAGVSAMVLSNILVGDAVCLKRKISGKTLQYDIIHEDSEKIIGSIDTSSNYVQDLISYMKIDKDSYVEMPASISDLYVSGVYSQVVDEQYLESHPELKKSSPNGVWKWIELVGIGHANYDVY